MATQITKVNLPDRTRARFEAENNQQRVTKPHDIRGAIPLVDYTNPAKFPPYLFREYPKMPLLDGNKPIVIDESGGVLVFYDAADEVDFKAMNEELAEEIERNAPSRALADTIAAKDAEIESMRAQLRAAGIEDAPKKPKNALASAVRPSALPVEGGLRTTLPKSKQGQAASNASAAPLSTATENPLRKKKH